MRHPFRTSASQAPNPRRAWTLTTLLAAAFLLAPGVLAGVKPDDAGTRLDAAPDPTGLREHFRDYGLQVMDPYLFRADLADGAVDVTLRGRAFHVSVEPAPWEASLRGASQRADGTWTYTEDAFGNVVYLGTVPAAAGSDALFVVTGSGVYGHVRTAEESLHFEPLRFHEPLAPVGVSIVFAWDDLVQPEDAAHRGANVFVPSEPGMPPTDGVGASYNAPGPDRSIALFADEEAGLHWNHQDRILGILSTVNANFLRLVGFKFIVVGNTVYPCPAANCPQTNLFESFANYARESGKPWAGYEVAHLFTGKTFSDHAGMADQPGRYGYSTFGASDSSTALIAAHELGHNFNARHARGAQYTHLHAGGAPHTHATIMGQPADRQWEFTSANAAWIRACNARSWSTTSFGNRCYSSPTNPSNWPDPNAGSESASYRGKYFAWMSRGSIQDVCVKTGSAGTLVLEFRALPGSQPLFNVAFPEGAAGTRCVDGYYTWNHDTMFVYKTSGTASLVADTTSPDGFRSDDFGATFQADGIRRAIEVTILPDNLPLDPCGVMASGTSLARNAAVTSCNGRYRLVHQTDGNVVLYNTTAPGVTKVDWATHTVTSATSTEFVMQADGNLVAYHNSNPVWASHTAGNPGATLALRDDGLLMVLGPGGSTLWVEGCGLLGPNSRIMQGKEIRSCDRRSALQHQNDGNVVLTRDGVPAGWATNTVNQVTREFRLQDDGNLVLYGPNGEVRWASDSQGNPNTWLRVQDDGKLILWTPYGTPICHKMKC